MAEDYTEVLLSDPEAWVNGTSVGFIELPAKFTCELDLFEYWRHLPQQLIFQVNMMAKPAVALGLEQINIDNIATALGGEDKYSVAGTQVTQTMQQKTVVACPFADGVNYVLLDGPNIATEGNKPVVKDYTEATTYTENDDWICDYDNGYLFMNPGGEIDLDDVLHITYKYTPPASDFVCLGQVTAMEQVTLRLESTSLLNGAVHKIYFPAASVAPKMEVDFGEPKKQTTIATVFTAVRSADYTYNGTPAPLGYYEIIPAS